MAEHCAFGYSCHRCYPHIGDDEEEEEEEEEEGEGEFICMNCDSIYLKNEYDKVIHYANGDYVCIDCICSKCWKFRDMIVIFNGIEDEFKSDEKFFKIGDKKYCCKECNEDIKNKKERLNYLIKIQ
jgi:hypothetical protein